MAPYITSLLVTTVQSLDSYTHEMAALISQVPYYTMAYRKQLLLFTRVRAGHTTYPLSKHLDYPGNYPHMIAPYTDIHRILSNKQVYVEMERIILSDVVNAVFSLYLRSVPFVIDNKKHEIEAFRSSFYKEFHATQGSDRPKCIDWSPFFDRSRAHMPIHKLIPVRTALHLKTNDILHEMREKLSTMKFFPRYSRRSVSKLSAEAIGISRATGIDLERFYHRHGYIPDAPMEVRQTWNYNDLSPRTYFAMGSTMYNASKYVQQISMLLVDSFEVTHRKHRFHLDRAHFDHDDDVWVYDYSAFTSNMTEQKYFLEDLSAFLRGTMITVVDTSIGELSIDVGEYLANYNRVCNFEPEFVLGPVLLKRLGIQQQLFVHRKAGSLGVYGNIATCTVGHGLVTSDIGGGPSRCGVVGDDGYVCQPKPVQLEVGQMLEVPLVSVDNIRAALRILGDIAEHKFAILDVENCFWSYLKRALVRHQDWLELGSQEHILNLTVLLNTRMSLRGKPGSSHESYALMTALARSIFSSFRRIHRFQPNDQEIRETCTYVHAVYRLLHLPMKGALKQWRFRLNVGGTKSMLEESGVIYAALPACPPPDQWYLLKRDPYDNLIMGIEDVIELREVPVLTRGRDPVPFINETGVKWRSTGSRALTLLRDLGYVGFSDCREEKEMSGRDWADFMRYFERRDVSVVREYTVYKKIPRHLVGTLAI